MLPGKGLEALLGSSLGAQLTAAVSSTVERALGVLTPAAEALVQDSTVGRANFTTLLRMKSYFFAQSRGELYSLGASGSPQYFNVSAALSLSGSTLTATWDSSVARRALEAAAAASCSPAETSLPGANLTLVELKVTPPLALLNAVAVTAAELSTYLSLLLLGAPPSAELAQFATAWSTCLVVGGNASGATLFWGAVVPFLPAVSAASSSASPAAAGAAAGVSSTMQALPSSTVGGIVGGVLAGLALLTSLCFLMGGGWAVKRLKPIPAMAEDAELTPDDLYAVVYPSGTSPQPESTSLPGFIPLPESPSLPEKLQPVKPSGVQLSIKIVSERSAATLRRNNV